MALWQNFGTAFFAQGMIFLFPLIIIGGWKSRKNFSVQIAFFGWLGLLFAESLLFPFASVRGGFFHAGAAFQPIWFVLAPIGLAALVVRMTRNKRKSAPMLKFIQFDPRVNNGLDQYFAGKNPRCRVWLE